MLSSPLPPVTSGRAEEAKADGAEALGYVVDALSASPLHAVGNWPRMEVAEERGFGVTGPDSGGALHVSGDRRGVYASAADLVACSVIKRKGADRVRIRLPRRSGGMRLPANPTTRAPPAAAVTATAA